MLVILICAILWLMESQLMMTMSLYFYAKGLGHNVEQEVS